MSSVKLEYIFIEKEKRDSQSVKKVITEIMKNTVDYMDDNYVRFDSDKEGECIKYRIFQKSNSIRCYLEMETVGLRINKATDRMKKLDDAFRQSPLQKYYYYIKEYDGISESFCIRLYPKYAQFERKLRQLILLVLTKAYGKSWTDETISEEMMDKIKENAKGNFKLNSVLENMDLATLEEYLFGKREPQYREIISTDLSVEKVTKMSKEELCIVIEKMRANSLWERNFSSYGDGVLWENRIKSVHNVRNKVAHQKTITEEEYKKTNKSLNSINRELDKVISNIQEHNYTEYESVDILGSFALIADKLRKNLSMYPQITMLGKIVDHFYKRMQEILQPVEIDYEKIMGTALKKFGSLALSSAMQTISTEAIKKIASVEIVEEVKGIAKDDLQKDEEDLEE